MNANTVTNIDLDRPAPALDGRNLADLILLWLESTAARLGERCDPPTGQTVGQRGDPRRFEKTTKGYAAKIWYFRVWWQTTGPAYEWVLRRDALLVFENWLTFFHARDGNIISYNTRADSLRRLRQMFRWAEQEGYVSGIQPSTWVPSPSGQPPERQEVTDSDLRRLIDAAKASENPCRDLAVLAVFVGTGIRRGECAGLDVTDVTIEADGTGYLLIRNAKRVRGVSPVRRVAFGENTGAALRQYLDELGNDSGPLWPSPRVSQGRLADRSIYRICRRIAQRAGVTMSAPCHDLRRKFATFWDRAHGDEGSLALLRLQMGHISPMMTDLYSLRRIEDVRAAHVSPMEGLNPNLQ